MAKRVGVLREVIPYCTLEIAEQVFLRGDEHLVSWFWLRRPGREIVGGLVEVGEQFAEGAVELVVERRLWCGAREVESPVSQRISAGVQPSSW